jgi:hypothetical protein
LKRGGFNNCKIGYIGLQEIIGELHIIQQIGSTPSIDDFL